LDQIKITLTFDDGLDSHLDHAIPLLDDHGLKATFYVNISSECLGRRANDWSKAASNRHELGNHSLLHPATSRKEWVREANSLENYTLDRMRMELEVANNVLRMLDRKTERTFAFPCSNFLLGKCGWPRRILAATGLDQTRIAGWVDKYHLDLGSSHQDFSGVVRDLFYAARTGQLSERGEWPVSYDRYRVPCIQGDGYNIEQLIKPVDKAIEEEKWIVFSFHGIGGGHGLFCELKPFKAFVKRLAKDDRIVVKTFIDMAKDIWGK